MYRLWKRLPFNIALVIGVCSLGVLLWYTLQLGVVRYFDADELAYLHWAHNVFKGQRPYYDFFSYVPSGFMYVLAPLFFFVKGAEILTVARLFAWMVQVGIVISLIVLYKHWRGSWFGVLAALVVVFLPLPKDKLIEVRPDNLAILISFIGLICQIRFIKFEKRSAAFWSGIFYGASLVILPKTLPQVAIALGITLLWWSSDWKKRWTRVSNMLVGILVPIAAFLLFQVVTAKSIVELSTLLYSLTRLPFEVNRLGEQFVMQPALFFYPNSTYYGIGGIHAGLIANHLLWIIGLLIGVGRLFTPFIPNGRKGYLIELLVAGTFLVYVGIFIQWYPLRHAQYLIPIALFVSLFVADGVEQLWIQAQTHGWYKGVFGAFSVLSIVFGWHIFLMVNLPKMKQTNAEDMRVIKESQRMIFQESYVLDMVGSTVYFRDPYYVSALPFGQYKPYLSRPLPSLLTALSQTNTPYIYEGRLDRMQTLSLEDQAYIRAQFIRIGDTHFWKAKGL